MPKVAPVRKKYYWRVAILAVLSIVFLVEIGLWFRGNKGTATTGSDPNANNDSGAAVASNASTSPVLPADLPPTEKLSNDGVISLVSEKIPTGLILSHIRAAKTTSFDLSTEQLIRLNKAGVPDVVIDQMRDPKRTDLVAPVVAAKLDTPVVPAKSIETAYVSLTDAMPMKIAVKEAIPMEAAVGRPVLFTLTEDFHVQGILVCARGSVVHGEITEIPSKKGGLFGLGNGKLSFALSKAETLGGDFINVRANIKKSKDGRTQQQVEISGKRPDKDIAVPPGIEYTAYVDGPQNVKVPKK